MSLTIGIIADFNGQSKSHLATNAAIEHAGARLNSKIGLEWVSTPDAGQSNALRRFQALWIGPGSPYESMEGALAAIRFARENAVPLLGTCGGFQHILIEYARNVLGITQADHEESNPTGSELVISRLACSLAGRKMTLNFRNGSMLRSIYGKETAEEEYLCNFGVNPHFEQTLLKGELQAVAADSEGAIRAVELPSHPFFLGTLFLPQHRSTAERPHPVITAFVETALKKGEH